MGYFSKADNPIRLTLARDRVRSLKRGHPWIFADYLAAAPNAPSGSHALLRDKAGKTIAEGFFDARSHLAFRACALSPDRLDDAAVERKLELALARRRALFGPETTGYRLLSGEGDGLPGLVCDVYGDYAVFQLDGAGPAGFWDLDAIAGWLSGRAGIANAYRKRRSGENADAAFVVRGAAPAAASLFLENGLSFEADLVHGQKTGFFFDQRDNRARIGSLGRGREVLNLFSYTGGFSVYAGSGGAARVTSVDLAKPAIEAARRNWELNALDPASHETAAEDVFEYLARAQAERRRWDLVIVDPPSFAPGKQHVQKATASYINLFTKALQVSAESGIFAASSCSSHISSEMFLEICEEAISRAKRRSTVLGIYGQPEDHPFPLACQELRYLKFVLLQLD